MKSTAAWILWFISTLVFLLSTRNPLYLVSTSVGLLILGWWLSPTLKRGHWLKQNLQFLSIIILVSSLINSLFTHSGKTMILTIPDSWPLIGGIITVESLVYGAINGLIIGCLFLLFNDLNLALSIKQITSLIPRAFYPIAMIVTIALTFFPFIQRRFVEIKEAQMIRGNPMKKFSDWMPLLVPLLVSSLENGLTLSESMTSRGFYTAKQEDNSILHVVALILGTFLVFSGWILSIYDYSTIIFLPLIFLGVFIIVFTLWRLGSAVKTTKYHHEELNRQDILAIGIMILLICVTIFFIWSDKLNSLDYSPYPSLSMPTFEIIPVLLSLLPILPLTLTHHDKN